MFYSCVVFGITISVMFPLLFSVPVELGFSITSDESSDIMICAALGEGVIAVIVGYFMNFFGINMLFYSILGISFILLITLIVMVKLLNNENEKDTQEIKTSKGNESNSEAHISEERR